MDRSILEIGRIDVILNDEQHSMLQLSSSSTIINANKNCPNNKIFIVVFLLIIQSVKVGKFIIYNEIPIKLFIKLN